MDIIQHKNIFLFFSGFLVCASIIALFLWGLRLGTDFTGGSLLEIEYFSERPSADELKSRLAGLGVGNSIIQPTGERGVLLRFQYADEKTHQEILHALGAETGDAGVAREKRFDTIGPTIGNELKRRSIYAIGAATVAIILYISWAFRHVSQPVSSWKYGTVAVVALIHDIIIPTGFFAVLGKIAHAEADTLFITALLTIMGFSVHDTIVVFDRIRENLYKMKVRESYGAIVSKSINETIARSVNTSLTTLFALLAVFVFGGESTKHLALALVVGIVAGTYSSIFVASPLLVIWNQWTAR